MDDKNISVPIKLTEEDINGLIKLLEPFSENEISHKPKPTKAQTEEVKRDFRKGARCNLCGGWHHPQVVHLSYVGHAATTKRLLQADPVWNWDFLCTDDRGMPIYDSNGGLWITLTIRGITRKGYGDAEGKTGTNAIKEIIGDGIRNAAMRFGVALEHWHKGEFDKITETVEPKVENDFYPEDQFISSFESWKAQIESGKKTAEQILDFLYRRGIKLTELQILTIKNVKAL